VHYFFLNSVVDIDASGQPHASAVLSQEENSGGWVSESGLSVVEKNVHIYGYEVVLRG
jgi:hypothetical protein